MLVGEVRLQFPARAEYLVLARLALAGLARAQPMERSLIADLKLAVTEASSNAVRHAYPKRNGTVRIVYELSIREIVISVNDDGVGIDEAPSAHMGSAMPADRKAPPESGMGLAIIRAAVDDVGIRTSTLGTTLRMRRSL